jgi:hypothetical protein
LPTMPPPWRALTPTTSRSAPAALASASLLAVATVDEIRLSAVNPVVVAVVAHAQPVADDVPEFRVGPERLDVMRFQSVRAA